MVKAALVALKDRTGSSAQAIAKYMKANFKGLPDNMPKQLSKCLKRCVENEKLKKVKAPYKLGTLKADPKPKKPKKKMIFDRRCADRSAEGRAEGRISTPAAQIMKNQKKTNQRCLSNTPHHLKKKKKKKKTKRFFPTPPPPRKKKKKKKKS